MHIERIQIEEEFLNAFDTYPRAGVSVIIGARGTSKTSLVGFIRFCRDDSAIKTSAVDPARWTSEAPSRCLSGQDQLLDASKRGDLDRDVVVVLFQGSRSNGLPVLHEITPALGVLEDKGNRVALFPDGRMQRARRNGPAASHLSAEGMPDSPLARLPCDSDHAGSGASAMLVASDAGQP